VPDFSETLPKTNGKIPNRILRSLPPGEYEELLPHIELVRLRIGQVLHEPGDEMRYVYFPNHGVLSMLTVLDGGEAVEIATVGNEGMADLSVFLGLKVATSRLINQVPGEVLRLERPSFLKLVSQCPGLGAGLGLYMVAMFTLVSQSAACNRIHSLEERCARWILMTHDRVDVDTFPLTQEFLSTMLGVRRPSVTVAAGMLQKAGFIAYSRGNMTVVDRAALEASACECYQIITEQFQLLPGGGTMRESGRRLLSSGLYSSAPREGPAGQDDQT
jgi:CRP-like cAMP-binding protein